MSRKRILTIVLALLGLLLVFGMSIMAASESGDEIVVLHTTDADGVSHETRLWVVDDAGHAWLRAGQPGSGWYLRLEAQPQVEVERGSESGRFNAIPVPDAATRDRIHALMRAKYGFADRWVSLLGDRSLSTAVRLDPIE
jgi:hypothetical protein